MESMRDNMVISGIPEQAEEDLEMKVIFFSKLAQSSIQNCENYYFSSSSPSWWEGSR